MLLRCAPDAPRRVFRERLETLRAAARDAGRNELLEFLEYLENASLAGFPRGGEYDESNDCG
jgi:hypothetical protein